MYVNLTPTFVRKRGCSDRPSAQKKSIRHKIVRKIRQQNATNTRPMSTSKLSMCAVCHVHCTPADFYHQLVAILMWPKSSSHFRPKPILNNLTKIMLHQKLRTNVHPCSSL